MHTSVPLISFWSANDFLRMVIAGGTLAPTSPIGIGVAIVGTVFASVCAAGAIATPALLRTYDYLATLGKSSSPTAGAHG